MTASSTRFALSAQGQSAPNESRPFEAFASGGRSVSAVSTLPAPRACGQPVPAATKPLPLAQWEHPAMPAAMTHHLPFTLGQFMSAAPGQLMPAMPAHCAFPAWPQHAHSAYNPSVPPFEPLWPAVSKYDPRPMWVYALCSDSRTYHGNPPEPDVRQPVTGALAPGGAGNTGAASHQRPIGVSEDLPCLTYPINILEIVALFRLINLPCSRPCL